MAAIGDSVTRAVNAAGPGERLASSWATGHDAGDGVDSIAERLVAREPALSGRVHNLAQNGAGIRAFAEQAQRAVDADAELVVVLLGGNDACRATAAQMTPLDAFRAEAEAGARVLAEGLPSDATVLVVSIPDVHALWEAGKENPVMRDRWRTFRPCPTILGDATSDEDRAAARDRLAGYNAILAETAEAYGFAWDGGAVHREPVRLTDVSSFDGFHPSLVGQARLADAVWAASPYAQR